MVPTRRSFWRVIALLSVVMLVLAACGDDDDDEGAGATTTTEEDGGGDGAANRDNVNGVLKIGSVLPSTGDLAVLGEPMNKAVEMALRDINATGGVLGKEVVLEARDDGTAEDIANDAVDALLGAGQVDAIVGPASSRVSLSVIDKITGAGVVQCSPSNTGVDFTTFDDDGFYFRTAPPDNLQARALVDNVIIPDGHGRVAILALADAYGQGFANEVEKSLEDAGATVPANVAYDPKGTNFDADVQEIVESDAEAVVLIAFPETGSTILREMDEQGVGPQEMPIYLTDGTQSSSLGGLVDPNNPAIVAGMKGTAPSAAPPTGQPTFAEAFAEFAPGVDTIFSGHAYDCVIVIALATQAAGTDDPAKIRDEMNGVTKDGEKCTSFAQCKELIEAGTDIDYDGAAGPLDFVDAGEPGTGDYDLWQFTEEVAPNEQGEQRNTIETIETVIIEGEGEGEGDAGGDDAGGGDDADAGGTEEEGGGD